MRRPGSPADPSGFAASAARSGEAGDDLRRTGRISALDAARGAAVFGMIVFHLFRDLEIFGWLPYGTTLLGGWPAFARLVATSFLALSGFSLWLAHDRGIRWRPFLRRLWILGLAAAGVSLATWLAMPGRMVHFGILHTLAASSLLGLAVLRLPSVALIALAALVWLLPGLAADPVFDRPWLWWLGLAPQPPPSLDYEPMLPWFAPFLLGIAVAKLAAWRGWLGPWSGPGPRLPRLEWLGRHALPVYLVHQPVLLGVLWLLRIALR